jgi:hypothetical protein
MHLEKYVSELLLRHNCLIIPGFGGFVARYSSAKIDWNRQVILPPSKELLFNKHLVQNDGLFINHIVHNELVSIPEATQLVNQQVINWNTLLQAGNRVEIEKVGLLYLDNQGLIVFEQDRFFNLLLSSFGLREVTFVAEKQITSESKSSKETNEKESYASNKEQAPIFTLNTLVEIEKEDNSEDNSVLPNKKVGFNWKYLAAAVLMPIGFFSFWIPMKTDVLHSGKIAFADFNPFQSRSSALYSIENFSSPLIDEEIHYSWEEIVRDLPKEIEVFNYRYSDDLFIPVRLIEKDKTTVDISTTQIVENKVTTTNSNSFHLIAGCFSSKENAENLISDLVKQGHQAQLLDISKGLHRVSIANYSTIDSAREATKTLAVQGIATWVLRK